MKRKLLAAALSLCMLLAMLPQMALFASATTHSGNCGASGNNLTWTLDTGTGLLTISGTGAMKNYDTTNFAPWYTYRETIKKLVVKDGATTVGNWAFAFCTNATSVTLPSSVKQIGNAAFHYCIGLPGITIPSGVTGINDNTFESCFGLTSVAIPNGVTTIGKQAFRSCMNLTRVTIPNTVTKIGEYAFSACEKLASITIPNSVTSVGKSAFSLCSALKSLTIPDSLTDIGDYAFAECTSLTGFTVGSANPNYSSDATGVLLNKDKTVLVCCPGGKKGTYSIPSSVTHIGVGAFDGCSSLTGITIPDSVTCIDAAAFIYCFALTDIAIPSSVTSIGADAFYHCNRLTGITIPASVKSIGRNAFASCDECTHITIENPECEIGTTYGTLGNPEIAVIYGHSGSTAEAYATQYAHRFRIIGTDPAAAFPDVIEGKWYYNAVNFALTNKLFAGISGNRFAPNQAMTRGMLVAVLWRLDGRPETTKTSSFTDVPAGQYYAAPVAWASEHNIVSGTGGNRFSPNANITREQMAAILYRYANFKDYDTTARADLSGFPDVGDVSGYAENALAWANAENLISGTDDHGTVYLDPRGNATRAQVASIFMRYVENIVNQ